MSQKYTQSLFDGVALSRLVGDAITNMTPNTKHVLDVQRRLYFRTKENLFQESLEPFALVKCLFKFYTVNFHIKACTIEENLVKSCKIKLKHMKNIITV